MLAAGTLGTTYLLLRNRAALPALSPALGTHFSGNGDLLTFAVRCREEAACGVPKPRVLDPAFGPVITSAIRVPDPPTAGARLAVAARFERLLDAEAVTGREHRRPRVPVLS